MSSLSPLTADWLEALAVARRALDFHDISPIWRVIGDHIELGDTHNAVTLVERDAILGTLHLHPAYEQVPRIERIEVLTYAACAVWFNLHYPGDAFAYPREAFQHLCRRAGCWHTNSRSLRERWRMIDTEQAYHLLPNAIFEDRVRCGVCRVPVATGAGAWVTPSPNGDKLDAHSRVVSRASTQAHMRLSESLAPHAALILAEAPDGVSIYRSNIHDECLRYAHRVMLPALTEQRKRHAQQASAEVDR